MDTIWYIAVPYVALAIFVVGHVWRYRVDQFGWTSRTSQVFESNWLRIASPLFHFGALMAIGGHAAGLLLPKQLTDAVGITEEMWHTTAVVAGTISGVMVCAGLILLLARRFLYSERVRMVTTKGDIILYVLLTFEIILGMIQTVGYQLLGDGFHYRETVSIWFRQIFYFHPDTTLMLDAPLVFKLHAITGFLILAVWPFTRLVHVWSVPLGYLARPYVVYRQRTHV